MHRPALKYLNGDAVMARLIKEIGPPTLAPRRLPTFASIAQAIVYQQLSGRVADVILGRFKKLYTKKGERFPKPKEILATPFEKMRGVGLSTAKVNAIRDLAQRTADGLVPTLEQCDDLTDAQLVDALTAIKGVGPWTVDMLLIFNLGRPDVLPHHDLGVRKGFQVAHGLQQLPSPERVARDGKRWSPHRTLAAWYLWRAADGAKEKKKK